VAVIGAWLKAPAGVRLLSARFAVDDDAPCAGGVPGARVRVRRAPRGARITFGMSLPAL
jgi:hypothetical protein